MTNLQEKKIPRQPMPEQEVEVRKHNFEEVPLGYNPELAQREASRCLQCKSPKCVDGCPVNIDIPGFIALIEEGKFVEAAWKLKEANALPAVCGRVCPQEDQCEKLCIVAMKGEPVAIGYLERFAADFERKTGKYKFPEKAPSSGKKVAVVGSGPAGLTAAGELVKLGHEVTILEALHEAGGVLMYGIPEFRLPKEIVRAEIEYLKKMGVKIVTDFVVGKVRTIEELFKDGYDAIFLGTGAGLPMFLGIPGENLIGVYSANEYLTRSNLMKSYLFPDYATPPVVGKKVVVIGGGNVAMDAARTALRFGAQVIVVYRRSRAEMPARNEEIERAKEEGIRFEFLTNPTRIIGNEKGEVVAIECLRMRLGEPDESGRKRPIPCPGTEFIIEADTVIPALGNKPNPLIPKVTPELKISKWGTIVVNEETMETSIPGVYAGGDIVSGAATVILAMGQGKIAARAMHKYLMEKKK